jgi:hypothetical protein
MVNILHENTSHTASGKKNTFFQREDQLITAKKSNSYVKEKLSYYGMDPLRINRCGGVKTEHEEKTQTSKKTRRRGAGWERPKKYRDPYMYMLRE